MTFGHAGLVNGESSFIHYDTVFKNNYSYENCLNTVSVIMGEAC